MPPWLLFGLGKVRSGIAAAFRWATASTTNLLIFALVMAAAYGFWQYHEAAKWERVAAKTEARRLADNRIWASADGINHASINTCVGALEQWSAFTRRWAATAKDRQTAAQAALRQATERGRVTEAHAQRIDAEAVSWAATGNDCKSGSAVLAARGEL